jgi:hypothetical protein
MIMRTSFLMLLAFGLLNGCVSATFTQTSQSYVVHRLEAPPEVFVDRLPQSAFDSVGIIEVQAPASADLSMILDAAKSKGQDVGCDVVVDRAIYRVGGANLRRWTVALAADADSAPPPSARRHSGDPYLGYAYVPAPQPAPIVYAPAPPPERREFICGIYRRDSPEPDEPPAAPGPTPN